MKTNLIKLISAVAGGAVIASAMALPAFAQTYGTAGIGVNVAASATVGGTNLAGSGSASATTKVTLKMQAIATAQNRADQEISRRITALNALSTRINNMVKVSASDKTSLSATISSQVTAMNNLQTQIASDAAANSTTSLKADIQSITKSYRIFILVIPQGAIEAAADRVLDVVGMFTTLSTQLQTRITAAQNAGANMSTETSALADMNAKVADANTQVNAAVTEVVSLQPDNGNATIEASNTATLKDARSKIMTAQQDLTAARADAGTIVKALLQLKVSAAASTTVSGSAAATP